MFSHIAWLTDGSAQAAACQAPVAHLARLAEAQIQVVAACEPGEADRARGHVVHVAQELSGLGLNAQPLVTEGLPEAWAQGFSHPDGLLAVGRTGHRGLARMGSTTRRVLREAQVPVLVGVPGFRNLERVLVGVDPEHAVVPLGPALELARRANAVLTVLTVAGVDQTLDSQDQIEQLRRMTRKALGTREAPRLRFEVGLSEDTAAGICAVAADHDLVLLGSHGRRGLARFVLGSVAEKVAEGAPVPVVVVPAR
jgi:nucleotide-binding universal stress UspA family protein